MMSNIQCGHPAGCISTSPYDDDDTEPYCRWCRDIEEVKRLRGDLDNRRYQHIENAAHKAVTLSPGIHELASGIPHTIYVMKGAKLQIGDDARIDTIVVYGGKVGMKPPVDFAETQSQSPEPEPPKG